MCAIRLLESKLLHVCIRSERGLESVSSYGERAGAAGETEGKDEMQKGAHEIALSLSSAPLKL